MHYMQKVDFPLELDVHELCSDDLRRKLDVSRQVYVGTFGSDVPFHVRLVQNLCMA